jgi:hypothetical protein
MVENKNEVFGRCIIFGMHLANEFTNWVDEVECSNKIKLLTKLLL